MVLLIALIVTIALIGIFGYTVLDAINMFDECGPIEKYIKSILAAICFPIYWIFRKKITNKYGCNINSGSAVNFELLDESLWNPPPVELSKT